MLRHCVFVFRAVIILSLALATYPASAAQFGTREEAVAMVKRVQERFQREGAERTFAAVTAQQKAFRDRDLYVYIMNFAARLSDRPRVVAADLPGGERRRTHRRGARNRGV